MDITTLTAYFDGKEIRLDLVVILPEQQSSDEHEEWLMLSKKGLSNAYGEDEVEYSVNMVKEVNPEYEGR